MIVLRDPPLPEGPGNQSSAAHDARSIPPILRLSQSTRSLLHSSVQLPTLASVAVQLAHNALDAGAKQVRLTIHLDSFTISCSDNGHGFEEHLVTNNPDAQIERNVTTKMNRGKYGSKGEALANMAVLGFLHIETTIHGRGPMAGKRWSIIQHHGNLINNGPVVTADSLRADRRTTTPPAPALDQWTTVTVMDMYRSMPVRREWSRSKPSGLLGEATEARDAIAELALREPDVGFFVETKSADSGARSSGSKVLLTCPAVPSLRHRFSSLRFPVHPLQCGSVYVKKQEIIPTLEVEITGFFVLEPHPVPAHQFVFLQGHKIERGTPVQELWLKLYPYEPILEQTRPEDTRRRRRRRCVPKCNGPDTGTLHRLIAKTVESKFGPEHEQSRAWDRQYGHTRHAAFLFDVKIRRVRFWADEEPWEVPIYDGSIAELVCGAIKEVQEQMGLVDVTQRSTAYQSRSRSDPSQRRDADQTAVAASPLHRQTMRRPPSQPDVSTHSPSTDRSSVAAAPAGHVAYRDPLTKGTFWIDEQTGNSYRINDGRFQNGSEAGASISEGGSATPRSAKRLRKSADVQPDTEAPPWLTDTLDSWENPALPLPATTNEDEPPIPSLTSAAGDHHAKRYGRVSSRIEPARQTRLAASLPLPAIQMDSPYFASSRQSDRHNCCGTVCSGHTSDAGSEQPDRDPSLLPSDAQQIRLASAKVIGQAARKFVLCSVPSNDADLDSQRSLICIDQHAADERVRFEQSLSDYVEAALTVACGNRSLADAHGLRSALGEGVDISLPINEADRISDSDNVVAQTLTFWGFAFRANTTAGPTSDIDVEKRVSVTHVPHLVYDRLRTDQNLLIGVVRSFVHWSPSHSAALISAAKTFTAPADRSQWMLGLRHLPPLLLDLIKSRACRGAIMFNDPLKKEQCHRLVVDQLSQCDFPLLCCHGRVGVAALCTLGDSESTTLPTRARISWERVRELPARG
ncbi:unnamed protein product [Jaminaea pallidilutea]